MSDNTFVPVPLPGDPIPEPAPEVVEEIIVPLEGIQDTGPRREDYIPERVQYMKRFSELVASKYTPVSDYTRMMIKNLDDYTRKEITMDEIKKTSPELTEYYIEMDDETYPNREDIVAYNYIRNKLLNLYEEEFGGK